MAETNALKGRRGQNYPSSMDDTLEREKIHRTCDIVEYLTNTLSLRTSQHGDEYYKKSHPKCLV